MNGEGNCMVDDLGGRILNGIFVGCWWIVS
jgi:hypothetical protein